MSFTWTYGPAAIASDWPDSDHDTDTDRPAPPGDLLIVEALPVGLKIVPFPVDHSSCRPVPRTQAGHNLEDFLLSTMPQIVALPIHPPVPRTLLCRIQRLGQSVQMFAGMIKIQNLMRLLPTCSDQTPNPRRPIANGH